MVIGSMLILLVTGLSGCNDSDVRKIDDPWSDEVKVNIVGDTDLIELVDYKVYTRYYSEEDKNYQGMLIKRELMKGKIIT